MDLKKIIYSNFISKEFKLKRKYPLEHSLYSGHSDAVLKGSNQQSVLFFTTQKTASSGVNKLFDFINREFLNMQIVDVSGFAYNLSSDEESSTLFRYRQNLFRSKGFIYAPVRDYVPLGDLELYRVLLFLRDPRDVLVSSYFSLKKSHVVPQNKERRAHFLNLRNYISGISVDEHVRLMYPFFLSKYTHYLALYRTNSSLSLLRYEDMINKSDEWADALLKSLDLVPDVASIEGVKQAMGLDQPLPSPNEAKHIRSKKPGDYRDKLSEDSINFLNVVFGDVIRGFGYEF